MKIELSILVWACALALAQVVLGLLGVGTYNTFAYIALQYTPATNVVLLNSVIPVATISLAALFLKQRLRRVQWAGVLLSLGGVAAIVSRGDFTALAGMRLNVGDLWMLGAIFAWAVYTLGLQWRPEGVHPMLLLEAFVVVGLLALAPAYAWEIAQGRLILVNSGALAAIAYTGVFPGFIGYIFYNRAVGEVGASKASLFIHLMPVFGSALAILFLGARPVFGAHLVAMTTPDSTSA